MKAPYISGHPIWWRNSRNQLFVAAIAYYVDLCHGKAETPDKALHARFLELVRDYFEYWIYAPCWSHDQTKSQILIDLRRDIQSTHSLEELLAWQTRCSHNNIDPI